MLKLTLPLNNSQTIEPLSRPTSNSFLAHCSCWELQILLSAEHCRDNNPVFEVKEMNCANSQAGQRFSVAVTSSVPRLICVWVSCDGLDVDPLWQPASPHTVAPERVSELPEPWRHTDLKGDVCFKFLLWTLCSCCCLQNLLCLDQIYSSVGWLTLLIPGDWEFFITRLFQLHQRGLQTHQSTSLRQVYNTTQYG